MPQIGHVLETSRSKVNQPGPSEVRTALQLHSSEVRTALQLHSSEVGTALQLHSSEVETVLQLYSSEVGTALQLHLHLWRHSAPVYKEMYMYLLKYTLTVAC